MNGIEKAIKKVGGAKSLANSIGVSKTIKHFVSKSCLGETCNICGIKATHKVGEQIPWDEPKESKNRHNFTAYVCCGCFKKIFGTAVFCTNSEKLNRSKGEQTCQN